jgi:hypothetical protein
MLIEKLNQATLSSILSRFSLLVELKAYRLFIIVYN